MPHAPDGVSRRFVLDGTNILLVHGRANPELRYVLALYALFTGQGAACTCYFDANTPYLLEERSSEQLQVFEHTARHLPWSDNFHIVPGGTQADEKILAQAKTDGADVISNDKFRSRARDNRWIWKRRHSVRGTRENLLVEPLGIEVPVLPTASAYL